MRAEHLLDFKVLLHPEGAAVDHWSFLSPLTPQLPVTGPGWTSDVVVPNRRLASNLRPGHGPAKKYQLSPSDSSPGNLENGKPLLLLGCRSWAQRSSSRGSCGTGGRPLLWGTRDAEKTVGLGRCAEQISLSETRGRELPGLPQVLPILRPTCSDSWIPIRSPCLLVCARAGPRRPCCTFYLNEFQQVSVTCHQSSVQNKWRIHGRVGDVDQPWVRNWVYVKTVAVI